MGNTESTLSLVLGGARSGKSRYAEALAPRLGRPVLYVATAEALDDEIHARIAAHRAGRPPEWATLEAPMKVGAAMRSSPEAEGAGVILLDCLTLLVSNVLLSMGSGGDPEASELDLGLARAAVQAEVEDLLEAWRTLSAHLIVVSNEVGLGLVPAYRLGRVYRDCLGWANQALARVADRAILMVAGLPLDLKELPLAWPD
jgi:adenosylcobinamide kinase/adenosylcobinamide-phosphate guanylyltransferase